MTCATGINTRREEPGRTRKNPEEPDGPLAETPARAARTYYNGYAYWPYINRRRGASPFPAAIDPNNPRRPSAIPADLYFCSRQSFLRFLIIYGTGLCRDRRVVYIIWCRYKPCCSTNGVTRVTRYMQYRYNTIHGYVRERKKKKIKLRHDRSACPAIFGNTGNDDRTVGFPLYRCRDGPAPLYLYCVTP